MGHHVLCFGWLQSANLPEDGIKLDEDDKIELKQLAEAFVFEQEFVTVINKETRLKVKNKYKSWFNGFTELKLSYSNVQENFYVKTTEDKGEIISPDYGLGFNNKNFTMKMYTCINVYSPCTMKDTNNLKFRLLAEIDTKKTKTFGRDFVLLKSGKKTNFYGSHNIREGLKKGGKFQFRGG